jgi:glucose/arabinose dehydrogenase
MIPAAAVISFSYDAAAEESSMTRSSALAVLMAAVFAAIPVRGANGYPPVRMKLVTGGLTSPISLTNAADGSGRLFIVEQRGTIQVWNGSSLSQFLDITAIVLDDSSERGLLGLAFHPSYESNGFFFVKYTDNAGDGVVARYTRSAANPNVADPNSAKIILTYDQPASNHNGGELQFGANGLLYISTGDGGSGNSGNGQNLNTLLGKILRIDINTSPDTIPYTIPAGNPFVGGPEPDRDEIWHYGLRNPWRFSFDRGTGIMFIGDVGEGRREEISIAGNGVGGLNFGWNVKEGTLCFNPPTGCSSTGLTDPIIDYDRTVGTTVTGGYVYRGSRFPRLRGIYVFGDFGNGKIWGSKQSGGTWGRVDIGNLGSPFDLTTFGEGDSGELYAVQRSPGSVYLIQSVITPANFNGDLTSDNVIYRNGAWVNFSGNPGVWTGQPSPNCIPAPGDYDGDGDTDLSIFCGGAWIFFNPNGSYMKGIWTGGASGELPVPADYDGDGDDDVAVYRNGAWVRFDYNSGSQISGVFTGPGPNTTPVPMDYDGDGTADFSVYAGGAWHFYQDNGSYLKGIWTGGLPNAVPVPADYDGNGTEDVVLFSNGAWRFYNFATGLFSHGVWTGAVSFNGNPLQPAPLDFDGDGSADFTVFAGGPWHSFNDNGSYRSGIWTGGVNNDQAISRRQHTTP